MLSKIDTEPTEKLLCRDFSNEDRQESDSSSDGSMKKRKKRQKKKTKRELDKFLKYANKMLQQQKEAAVDQDITSKILDETQQNLTLIGAKLA